MTEQDYDLDEKSNSLSNLLSSSGYSKLRFILTVTAFTISSLVIVAIVVPVVILLQNKNGKIYFFFYMMFFYYFNFKIYKLKKEARPVQL